MNKTTDANYRAGFVGLIGQPNAGKSTLMNYLIEQKVSIVTAKPQTTRRRILGIQTRKNAQIVFVDAPGLVKAEKGLNAFLEKEAHEVIHDSDALIAVLSVDEKDQESIEKVLSLVTAAKKPWLALITKSDLQDKLHRIMIIRQMVEVAGGKSFTVSSVGATNTEDKGYILDAIEGLLPQTGAPLYDEEMYTTENMRQLVAEIVREKCFESMNHEVPYQTAVVVRDFKEDAKPCPHIYADVIVAKESHKPMLIGQKAEQIKKISQASRMEIEKIMGQKVYLELKVVVKENWFEKNAYMKELGYVINDK